MTLTKWIEFDAGHRVPGHTGQCRNPHGHRYRCTIEVEGVPQPDGMVIDFGIVKELLNELVHDRWDHAFIVWASDDELIAALDGHGWKVALLDDPPTAEHLAADVMRRMRGELWQRTEGAVTIKSVTIRETPSSAATVSL